MTYRRAVVYSFRNEAESTRRIMLVTVYEQKLLWQQEEPIKDEQEQKQQEENARSVEREADKLEARLTLALDESDN